MVRRIVSYLPYTFFQILFRVIGTLLWHLRVIGHHHIPRRGGVLVAANHTSYADIPFVGCSMRRKASFMGKAYLFRNPIVGAIYRFAGGFPVERDSISPGKLTEAVRRLKAGEVVVIYPEGARSRDGKMQPGQIGIGMIVTETGVPVVPAFIAGAHKVLPLGAKWPQLHPVTVIFGEPIDFSYIIGKSTPSKEVARKISEEVMSEIRKLGRSVEAREAGDGAGPEPKVGSRAVSAPHERK
jgi:1-acyl-sn-glycerol-3-phosphate acyltransferase